jgi:4-hydroxy-tetrahydrodipicolinate synthase
MRRKPPEMSGLQGVYAAAVTPRGKQGDLDFGAAFELVDFLGKAGVSGIALFTGTGEYPALGRDERSRLVYLAVKRSRVPVLVGVGSATLDDSVLLASEARDAGAEAVLLPPPYYFRYEQDEIREFYVRFAAQSAGAVPVVLSNHPRNTTAIAPETARELVERGGIDAVEDASDEPEGFEQMRAAVDGRAHILAGNDDYLARAFQDRAQGAISPVAGVVPELVTALARATRAGALGDAVALERMLQEFLVWRREFPEPAILKTAAALRGVKVGALLAPLSAARQKRLEEFREWFQGWLPAIKKLSASA